MIGLLAAVVAAGVALPHALRLQCVHPVTAIVLWLSSLALRALTAVLAVLVLLFAVPGTGAFAALTHWCLHVPLALAEGDVHVEGHGLADAALLVPGIGLAVSLVYMGWRTARSALQARHLIRHEVIGEGPGESLIVSGPEVLFAVAGLMRPRIVVSAGALAWLDDDELRAALDHERAHIVRRHRFVVLFAVALAAVGRAVPGSRRALHELGFHLERDADRWALGRRNDRLALASAICSAAAADPGTTRDIAGLGRSGVRERLGQLLREQPATPTRPAAAALNALAIAMVGCALLLSAVVPAAAVAFAGEDPHRAHHTAHCRH